MMENYNLDAPAFDIYDTAHTFSSITV